MATERSANEKEGERMPFRVHQKYIAEKNQANNTEDFRLNDKI